MVDETGEGLGVEAGEVETGEGEGLGRGRGRPAKEGRAVHLKLPQSTLDRAEAWAARAGVARAEVLRLALDAGLDALGV